jgi:hypothetical protein
MQHFYGNATLDGFVNGFKDSAHSSAAQLRDDAIGADTITGADQMAALRSWFRHAQTAKQAAYQHWHSTARCRKGMCSEEKPLQNLTDSLAQTTTL